MQHSWNINTIELCMLTGSFLRITDHGVSCRIIIGVARVWGPHEKYTILTRTHRISGSPRNVAMALRNTGISDNEIKEILTNSITYDNHYDPITKQYSQEYLNEVHFHNKMFELRKITEVTNKNYDNVLKMIRVSEPWIVKYFLQLYSNIDIRDFNNKAYYVAIECGNPEIIGMISQSIIERDWLEREAWINRIQPLEDSDDLSKNIYQYARKLV